MDIFEMIQRYGSIVWGSRDKRMLVTYNGKSQFNIFRSGNGYYTEIDVWNCADTMPVREVEHYVDSYMKGYYYASS